MIIDQMAGQYASINGLEMYYELHGKGEPVVLLHGGGSTITSNYRNVIPWLVTKHLVIAVELQAHGRTSDIDRALTFTQDADDVAALLAQLRIKQAGFIGFSNGATTCMQLAIRHPELVNKLILASGAFERDGMIAGFFEGMKQASMDHMPLALKEAFLAVNPNQAALTAMFNRDVARMNAFEDINADLIAQIEAPTLIINGDRDVVTIEHAMRISKLISGSRLMILPSGHGDYFHEVCTPHPDEHLLAYTMSAINSFLTNPLA